MTKEHSLRTNNRSSDELTPRLTYRGLSKNAIATSVAQPLRSRLEYERLVSSRSDAVLHEVWCLNMAIRTKRWDDAREPEDGYRVLITRYRPRALPKADETWEAWLPNLAPSAELHAAFYGKGRPPIGWQQYRARYLREMKEQISTITELAKRAADGETITLLCSSACILESRCHRSLLKALIEEHMAIPCS